MQNEITVELALQDGIEYRKVAITLDSLGAMKIDAHDMGPTVEQVWDHDDYEFSVTVPPAGVARLAFELLKEKFAGDLHAVDAFREFCQEHQISHQFSAWP